MNDITNNFGTLYHPVKAFVVFEKRQPDYQYAVHVESYVMDRQGRPINGHPLSIKEGNALAKALTVAERKSQNFLNPAGLMPRNVLSVRNGSDNFAIWHTPKQSARLLFTDTLGIPTGIAQIPALIWKAYKNHVRVFALSDIEVDLNTHLYHAPFFNVYADGRVCMGNVKIDIPKDCHLEQFMKMWEDYFFGSYFSHLFDGHLPVNGNIVQLWQNLINSATPFPNDLLKLSKHQLKDLLK